MKDSVFSLQDSVYHCVVTEVLSFLASNGVGAMVVGGVAVQAHTLKMAADARLLLPPDFLRRTDDLDMVVTTAVDQPALMGVIRKLAEHFKAFIGEAGETVFEVGFTRVGAVKPLLQVSYVSPDGQTHTDDIKLNLSFPSENRMFRPEFRDKQETESITLSHIESASKLQADVICIEHLVVNKLAKAREKDLDDAGRLAEIIKKADAQFSVEKAGEALKQVNNCSQELKDRYYEFLSKAGKDSGRKMKRKPITV
jgi:hypothetical protein